MNPASLAFLNLGGQEMIVIFLVILLLFGAKKLPELARGVGKSMGEFKKARDDFEREISRGEDETKITRASTADVEKDLAKKEEELRAREAALAVREAGGKEPREHV